MTEARTSLARTGRPVEKRTSRRSRKTCAATVDRTWKRPREIRNQREPAARRRAGMPPARRKRDPAVGQGSAARRPGRRNGTRRHPRRGRGACRRDGSRASAASIPMRSPRQNDRRRLTSDHEALESRAELASTRATRPFASDVQTVPAAAASPRGEPPSATTCVHCAARRIDPRQRPVLRVRDPDVIAPSASEQVACRRSPSRRRAHQLGSSSATAPEPRERHPNGVWPGGDGVRLQTYRNGSDATGTGVHAGEVPSTLFETQRTCPAPRGRAGRFRLGACVRPACARVDPRDAGVTAVGDPDVPVREGESLRAVTDRDRLDRPVGDVDPRDGPVALVARPEKTSAADGVPGRGADANRGPELPIRVHEHSGVGGGDARRRGRATFDGEPDRNGDRCEDDEAERELTASPTERFCHPRPARVEPPAPGRGGDRCSSFLQLGSRLDPELVVQPPPTRPIRLERAGRRPQR